MQAKPSVRPGVLLNRHAKGVRGNPQLVDRLRRRLPAVQIAATESAEDVVPAVGGMLEEGIDALLVVGGDGTWTGTLTPLLRHFPPDALPVIVPCRGGTVNTIARSFRVSVAPERTLESLLAGELAEERRAVVRVVADGAEPRFGWIFVVGAGVRFLELYYQEKTLGPRAAFAVVTKLASSALFGGTLARSVFAPFHGELCVDGDRIAQESFTVLGAAGVREIGLGFAPFVSAGTDPERIHLTTTKASAARISLELPALRSGVGKTSLAHFPLREGEVALRTPLAWTLDAELFPPASHFDFGAGPALRVAIPPDPRR